MPVLVAVVDGGFELLTDRTEEKLEGYLTKEDNAVYLLIMKVKVWIRHFAKLRHLHNDQNN